jgi:mannose-6-phosphate isomerase-like protein (cupin superfamily)
MSYPDPVYLDEPGLAAARLRPADHEPEIRQANGGAAHYLARGDETDGQFGLYRWEMSAARSGPGAHFHRAIKEAFYVLSGTIKLFDGRSWLDGRPGDFLLVPEGGLHGFRNESGEPASMLILFTPGAPREAYFETTARMGAGLQLSDEEKLAFYLEHDTFWR